MLQHNALWHGLARGLSVSGCHMHDTVVSRLTGTLLLFPCSPVQGKQILQDGIGRASEVEEEVDPQQARTYLQHPTQLLQHTSELMQNLARWV